MWKYNKPTFEFSREIPLSYNMAPWGGHSYFAYDLVVNTRPKVIVELGTYKGNSLFAMAQAVKDFGLKTKLHAVDTWQGDRHAGFYGEGVYNTFSQVKESYYKDLNIIPHRTTFDKAQGEFKDKSIDILHIDGLHTYEAVKHDFDNWLCKVKDDGVIMLHDVEEIMGDFGVYKLWGKLQGKYETLTFKFYHGLGVIFLGEKPTIDVTPYYILAGGLG